MRVAIELSGLIAATARTDHMRSADAEIRCDLPHHCPHCGRKAHARVARAGGDGYAGFAPQRAIGKGNSRAPLTLGVSPISMGKTDHLAVKDPARNLSFLRSLFSDGVCNNWCICSL